jgi:hypothetical protein
VIDIVRDQRFYFFAVLCPLQSPVADNAAFSQLRIAEIQHVFHLKKLFGHVV